MIEKFKNTPDNPNNKKAYNQELFATVAPQYDRITRVLSCGQDAGWKKKLLEMLPNQEYKECLDLACGTGDITFLLAQKYPLAHITGLDLTPDMISYAESKNNVPNVTFICQDMCQLTQKSASVDLVTGGYALRNAPDLRTALEHIHRVLKPDGIAAFLDFSKPTSPLWAKIEYHLLSWWGSLWGLIFHKNPAVYAYIADSLQRYPNEQQLNTLLHDVGFEVYATQKFFGGITQITVCRKK